MPSWVFIAIVGYFLGALTKVFDKVLLRSVVREPILFTFFTCIVSAFVLLLLPFGFEPVAADVAASAFGAGIAFVASLFFFFLALKKFEISRVVPLVAGIAPSITFVLSYVFLGERLGEVGTLAVIALIAGGALLSVDLSSRAKFRVDLFIPAFASSFLLGIYFILTKFVFAGTSFINGFLWSRMGILAAALILILLPGFFEKMRAARMPRPKNIVFFFLNKCLGALSLFGVSYALANGQTSIVHALGGFEYVSAFILSILLSGFMPRIFTEEKSPSSLAVKFFGTLLLSLSLMLLYIS